MTYRQCTGCNSAPDIHVVDPRVSESVRFLDQISSEYGDNFAEYLVQGGKGQGPLAQSIRKLGAGETAVSAAEPGDIIIGRGLFPENDPRIDIVGFQPDTSVTALYESFQNGDFIEIYRPVSDSDAAPALGALLRKAAPAIFGAVSAGGNNPVRSAIQTANDALDLGIRVYKLTDKVLQRDRLPSYESTPLRLEFPNAPPGLSQSETDWTFTFYARVNRGSNIDAIRVPMRVRIIHDCFNIQRADILPTRTIEAGLLRWKRKLDMKIEPSVKNVGNFPPTARFRISGTWTPDLVGDDDIAIPYDFYVNVGANGHVSTKGIRNSWFWLSGLSPQRGYAGRRCHAAYAEFRKSIVPTPSIPPGVPPGVPRTPTPRLPGPRTPTIPHPTNGRHIFFGFNSANPRAYARGEVSSWWRGLGAGKRSQIQSGSVNVYVTGHADPTGGDAYNITLSRRRAEAIAQIMYEFTGRSARLVIDGKGFRDALANGARRYRRDQNWRRVTISLGSPG